MSVTSVETHAGGTGREEGAAGAFEVHDGAREAQARRVLRQMADRPDVWTEATADGPDYIRVCTRHQWAGLGVPDLRLLEACPLCDAELSGLAGRVRYALSQRARLVPAEG